MIFTHGPLRTTSAVLNQHHMAMWVAVWQVHLDCTLCAPCCLAGPSVLPSTVPQLAAAARTQATAGKPCASLSMARSTGRGTARDRPVASLISVVGKLRAVCSLTVKTSQLPWSQAYTLAASGMHSSFRPWAWGPQPTHWVCCRTWGSLTTTPCR